MSFVKLHYIGINLPLKLVSGVKYDFIIINSNNMVNMEFVGYSRIDGQPIFSHKGIQFSSHLTDYELIINNNIYKKDILSIVSDLDDHLKGNNYREELCDFLFELHGLENKSYFNEYEYRKIKRMLKIKNL
jgi:hypothetical protein